jgi:hypothetical protein
MNSKEFTDFLLKAKRATYAGDGPTDEPWRPQSHDLHFAEGDFLYIDTYLGGMKFTGEEAVWQQGQPLWAMNYTGRVLTDGFSGDFLKEALSLGTVELPYRGPKMFQNGEFTYNCAAEGALEWFNGRETITLNGILIYECLFHGGIIE